MSISLNGDGIISGVTTLTTTPLDVITLDVTEINVGTGASVFSPATNTLAFGTNGSERLRVLAAGGLTFNGDTAAANALDDYEEGTWTPTLGGNATYTVQQGRYTKVGNIVNVTFRLKVDVLGTGSNATMSGMPFTGEFIQAGYYGGYFNLATNVIFLAFYFSTGSNIVNVSQSASGASVTNGPVIYGNGTEVIGGITYRVS